MQMKVKAGLVAILMAFSCISMCSCQSSGNIEDNLENNLNALDEMDEEVAEEKIEEAFDSQNNEDDGVDSESALIAEYLAKNYFTLITGYIARESVEGNNIETVEEAVSGLIEDGYIEEKKGSFTAKINGKEKEIKYNIDDATITGEISNGSVVYITVTYDGETRTYPEGADEIEKVDPFENLTVTFSGTAPKSEISVSGGNSLCSYTPDITEGMKNGDIITITAELKSQNDEVVLSETQKQYTADGLASYAMKLEDIPEDILEKIKSQAEDSYKSIAAGWAEGNSLKNMEFLGYYFLSAKEGFSPSPTNQIFAVYKITATITGIPEDERESLENDDAVAGEEVFYTFFQISDIIILPDGTGSIDLSSGDISGNEIKSTHGYWSWGYFEKYTLRGYSDLDSMFNKCVTEKIDEYTYESTVQE